MGREDGCGFEDNLLRELEDVTAGDLALFCLGVSYPFGGIV